MTWRSLGRALRARRQELSEAFDVVLVDAELPPDVALHPGHRRQQAYLARRDLDALSAFFEALDPHDQQELVDLVIEALRHEDEHLRQYRSTLGAHGPPSERAIDAVAPSFRARALFRLLYAFHKTGRRPNLAALFVNLRQRRHERSSYLHGYLDLSLDVHLEMARRFLAHRPSTLDKILAQHHLGAIFRHAEPDSPVFQEAVRLLQKGDAVDLNPETNKLLGLWRFIHELVLQNMLIEEMRPVEQTNVKATHVEQFEPWVHGDQTSAGDSLSYPKPGETVALPVDLDTVSQRIASMRELNDATKAELMTGLQTNAHGQAIISREALYMIGTVLLDQTVQSISGAGKGERYAQIRYDEAGNKFVIDKAKGTYPIQMDGSERSILEVAVAQVRGLNLAHQTQVSLDVHVSHFTEDDVARELRAVGYGETLFDRIFHRGLYRHPTSGSPVVRVIRVRKTHVFDLASGDFYKHVEPDRPWSDVFWPDAHDTTLVDIFVSGRAYELLQEGRRFLVVSNVDNRAGVPDPVVLAILHLSGAPLVNEISLKPEGQRGGSAVRFKASRVPEAIRFGQTRGLLEEFEFDRGFLQGLSTEEVRRYFSLFNTANYTLSIIEFARRAFMPDASDAEVVARLKEFYDAREDPDRVIELRYHLLERYRNQTQLWERERHFPALRPANLAGTVTWLVPTLFLEVPTGEPAGRWTRFEPLKENILNLQQDRQLVQRVISRVGPEARLQDAVMEHALAQEEAHWSDLRAAYHDRPGLTLGTLLAQLDGRIRAIEEGLRRVEAKGSQRYTSRGEIDPQSLFERLERLTRSEHRMVRALGRALYLPLTVAGSPYAEEVWLRPWVEIVLISGLGLPAPPALSLAALPILALFVGVDLLLHRGALGPESFKTTRRRALLSSLFTMAFLWAPPLPLFGMELPASLLPHIGWNLFTLIWRYRVPPSIKAKLPGSVRDLPVMSLGIHRYCRALASERAGVDAQRD